MSDSRERGEWKMRTLKVLLLLSHATGVGVSLVISTSSLRIVPPPLPQRAATTLINYPNFLIQATFDIDRTTLETVEKRCRWTGPAPEVQPSS